MNYYNYNIIMLACKYILHPHKQYSDYMGEIEVSDTVAWKIFCGLRHRYLGKSDGLWEEGSDSGKYQ